MKNYTVSYRIIEYPNGSFKMLLFANGMVIRQSVANGITKKQAMGYIKECWKYINKTPYKRENPNSVYFIYK